MNGLELSRRYFEEYGKPMLERDFSEIMPLLAAGFVGSGSERFGFDDEISRDHDFEPGFCLFLPDKEVISERTEFLLERAYAKLPSEFLGFRRGRLSPVGGNRCGIMRTAEFYLDHAGTKDGLLNITDWFTIPDSALAEAVNGEVFFDNYGEFTRIRNSIINMPKDIRLKKIAGNVLTAAQSGQYNFLRCISHGEPEAAQLALYEFANAAMKCIFLINKRYMPFYKWSFRALGQIDGTASFAGNISLLLCGDNRLPDICEKKADAVEDCAAYICSSLRANALTREDSDELEKHAYSINSLIKDGNIRNMNILCAV